jgi:DNA transposition AAA+ family ATPase
MAFHKRQESTMQDDFAEQQAGRLPAGPKPEADTADVERAIQQTERVQMASLKLPDTGAIPEDLKVKVCERIQAIRKQRGVSLRSLAQQLGGTSHEAILSQVLRRAYDHEDSDHIRRMNAWAEAVERRAHAMRPVGICDTGVARLLRTGCDYAKSNGCIVLLTGPAGIGKSVAAKVYASEDMNCIYVRLQSTHTSPTAFLRKLAEACRVDSAGSRSATMDAIVTRLRGSHRLVVLDEWHLAERPLYETIRDLYDVCEIPIALIGTEEVSKRVQSARLRKGSVWSDQFCSRIGWVLDLTKLSNENGDPRPLFTVDEIRSIFKSDQIRITREGIDYLQALACSVGLGCLRIAQRCYTMATRMVRRDKEITASHLRKAFRRQAVPEGIDDSALLMQVEETLQQIRNYSVAVVA